MSEVCTTLPVGKWVVHIWLRPTDQGVRYHVRSISIHEAQKEVAALQEAIAECIAFEPAPTPPEGAAP